MKMIRLTLALVTLLGLLAFSALDASAQEPADERACGEFNRNRCLAQCTGPVEQAATCAARCRERAKECTARQVPRPPREICLEGYISTLSWCSWKGCLGAGRKACIQACSIQCGQPR